jgi:predicted dithiol-disulfide oxidoreductase (DUF899 family)
MPEHALLAAKLRRQTMTRSVTHSDEPIPNVPRIYVATTRDGVLAADNVGTDLASGMAESPGWNIFALEDGVVDHTYSRTAPDCFLLAPYYYLVLDQIPDGRDADFPLRRHDEY